MATVIKASRFEGGAANTRTFTLKDIQREADEILDQAREKAERLVRDAQAKAKEIRKSAHANGLTEGTKEGLEEGREEGRRVAKEEAREAFARQQAWLVDALTEAMNVYDADRQVFLSQARVDLVDLMLAVARRVVKRIGAIDRQVVVENFQEALLHVAGQADLRICLHPVDVQAIEVFAASLSERAGQWRHVSIVADEAISPGGCVVKSGQGEVDARLETQLENISALLVRDETESR